MEVRSERYRVVSQGVESPESLPETTQVFTLAIRSLSARDDVAQEVAVSPRYVDRLGGSANDVVYARVWGEAHIDGEVLPCVAKFQVRAAVPQGREIGELVTKRVIRTSSVPSDP
jgi:hypothetical protein